MAGWDNSTVVFMIKGGRTKIYQSDLCVFDIALISFLREWQKRQKWKSDIYHKKRFSASSHHKHIKCASLQLQSKMLFSGFFYYDLYLEYSNLNISDSKVVLLISPEIDQGWSRWVRVKKKIAAEHAVQFPFQSYFPYHVYK